MITTKGIKDKSQFLYAFQTCLIVFQHVTDGLQFLLVGACQRNDGLKFLYLFLCQPVLAQLGIHIVQSYLIQFVNSHGNVNNLVGSTNDFSDTSKYLTVVDFDCHTDAEAFEHFIDYLHQLNLVEQ